jgi:RNA recognition motif-containing protein
MDNIFSQIGKVVDCIVKQYRLEVNPHKQSGYGFVYFQNIDDALIAIKTFKNKIIDGIQLDCNFSSEADAIKYAGRLEELYRSSPSYGPQGHLPEVLKFKPQGHHGLEFSPELGAFSAGGLPGPFMPQSTPSYLMHPGSNTAPLMPMSFSGNPGPSRSNGLPLPSHIVIPPVQQQQLMIPSSYPRDGSSPTSYQVLPPASHASPMYFMQQQSQPSYHHHHNPNMGVPMKYGSMNTSSLSLSSVSSSPSAFSQSHQGQQVYHHPQAATIIY